MKFRKLLGGGLLAAVLALGGVAGLAARSESKSVSAEGDRYYIRGDKSGWGTDDTTRYVDNDNQIYTFSLQEGETFKLSYNNWSKEINSTQIAGTAVQLNYVHGNSSDTNIYSEKAMEFNFQFNGTTLYIDVTDANQPVYNYVGDTNDWQEGTTFTPNVTTRQIEMPSGNKFKFKVTGTWNGELNSQSLNDNYYNVFTQASSSSTDIVCGVSATYSARVIIVDHAYKIELTGYNLPTKRVYVLDKYHDRLTNDPRAHIWNDNGQGDEFPGNSIASIENFSNIYKLEYWEIFTKTSINSSNGTYQSIDYTLTSVEGKCLILDHYEEDGKWGSNIWVSLEVAKYIDTYMHFADYQEYNYPEGSEGDGKCVSEDWYIDARNAYQASSFEQYREELCTLDYVVARLQAWATANSATFTPEGGFVPSQRIAPLFGTMDNSMPIMLVVIISVVSLTAVGGYIFLKRRKED